MTSIEYKSIFFQNIELAYFDSGSEKPPILFCHANGYSSLVYRKYWERLIPTHRVIALDFAGHGKSGAWMGFKNWLWFRDQICFLIQELGLKDVIGVGHSLGGASLLQSSVVNPGIFKKLIVWDPTMLGWKYITYMKFLDPPIAKAASRKRREFESVDQIRKLYRRVPLFSHWDPEIFEDYLSSCTRKREDGKIEFVTSPEHESQVFRQAHYSVFMNFFKVSSEVHVAFPIPYEVCNPNHAKLITKKNPRSSVTRLEGKTHLFPMEDPITTWEHLSSHI
jgi:pimeloyl-ACP methyl ester carboxylesterase